MVEEADGSIVKYVPEKLPEITEKRISKPKSNAQQKKSFRLLDKQCVVLLPNLTPSQIESMIDEVKRSTTTKPKTINSDRADPIKQFEQFMVRSREASVLSASVNGLLSIMMPTNSCMSQINITRSGNWAVDIVSNPIPKFESHQLAKVSKSIDNIVVSSVKNISSFSPEIMSILSDCFNHMCMIGNVAPTVFNSAVILEASNVDSDSFLCLKQVSQVTGGASNAIVQLSKLFGDQTVDGLFGNMNALKENEEEGFSISTSTEVFYKLCVAFYRLSLHKVNSSNYRIPEVEELDVSSDGIFDADTPNQVCSKMIDY